MEKKELNEFYNLIKPVLRSYEFQRRKTFMHHENESVYIHSLRVSLLAYKFAKRLKVDFESVAIGALLHDFYINHWQGEGSIDEKKFFKKHGFTHAKIACENAKKEYEHLINPKIENIILRHMFPLNIIPPKYFESWVVTFSDKIISLSIFKHPTQIPKYLGIKKGK